MRVMALAIAASVAVLFTVGEGRAGFLSGQSLKAECDKGDSEGSGSSIPFGVCSGYIQGIFDAGRKLPGPGTNRLEWPGGWTACPPEDLTAGQLRAVVMKWIRENPKNWHYNASGLVAAAIEMTWPCP